MTATRPFAGFTLIELLISLALISFLASLSAFQGIALFGDTIMNLKKEAQLLQEKAAEGKIYRHISLENLGAEQV